MRLTAWVRNSFPANPLFQILLRYGGLYVDVDFLCLGAFDDLHRRYEMYTGMSNTGTFELNNGLVG